MSLPFNFHLFIFQIIISLRVETLRITLYQSSIKSILHTTIQHINKTINYRTYKKLNFIHNS